MNLRCLQGARLQDTKPLSNSIPRYPWLHLTGGKEANRAGHISQRYLFEGENPKDGLA